MSDEYREAKPRKKRLAVFVRQVKQGRRAETLLKVGVFAVAVLAVIALAVTAFFVAGLEEYWPVVLVALPVVFGWLSRIPVPTV